MTARPLLLLFAPLLLFACSTHPEPTLEELAFQANDHMNAVLRAEVKDPIRVQRTLTVAERIRFAEEYYFEQQRALDERLFELNAARQTTRAEFFAVFQEIHELRREAREELVSLHLELKGHMTAGEWARAVEATRPDRQRVLEVMQ